MKPSNLRPKVALLLLGVLACSNPPESSAPGPSAKVETASRAKPEAAQGPLSFVHDDYATALATARTENKPLFVEFWAPW